MGLTLRYTQYLLAGIIILFTANAVHAENAPLLAGVSMVDITPPRGYRMAGYYNERFNTGQIDPLHAKIILFKQGDLQVGLIFCDLIGMPGPLVDQARPKIEQATGIPASNLVICATHSHTGPLFFGLFREQFHEKAIEELGKDPHEEVNYDDQLTEAWIKGLQEAKSTLAPVQLNSGAGKETRLAFNRRFHMKDGTVRFNPGIKNPDIIRTAGPVDPTVDVICVRSTQNDKSKDLGAIVSFAMHLDTKGGTEYSADYPAYLQKEMQKKLGPDAICLFGTGTCGDINHVNVTEEKRNTTEEIGRMLGETANQILDHLKPVSNPHLAIARVRYQQDVQKVTPEQVAEAKKFLPLNPNVPATFTDLVKAYTTLDLLRYKNGKMDVEITAVALNDHVAMVFLPGEIFVELGMAIKDDSPFEQTLVVELSQDCPYYVPTRRAFQEGSYEVMNSRIMPGGGEIMVEKSHELLQKLAKQTAR